MAGALSLTAKNVKSFTMSLISSIIGLPFPFPAKDTQKLIFTVMMISVPTTSRSLRSAIFLSKPSQLIPRTRSS